jgi:hypothetical protein
MSLDKTRVVCNPHGYPRERNKAFREDLILDVKGAADG